MTSGAGGKYPLGLGPELIAKAIRSWIADVGARTTFIEKGSPWERM